HLGEREHVRPRADAVRGVQAVGVRAGARNASARGVLRSQERLHLDGGLNMGRLDGKVCVITGAGGGMGREAAIVFTGEGAKVCVVDVDMELAEETVSECPGDAFALRVDVADEGEVAHAYAATVERFGGVDVLYNNAGISPADDASVLDTGV